MSPYKGERPTKDWRCSSPGLIVGSQLAPLDGLDDAWTSSDSQPIANRIRFTTGTGYFRLGQSDVASAGERPIMKAMHVTTAVVWALTTLLFAPLDANAGGRGGGVRV